MAKGKKNKTKWVTGVCEVEKFTDGNTREKKVFFCPDCQAFMCKKCSGKFGKRAMAMINRDLQTEYPKKNENQGNRKNRRSK